jgi:hypothetical protein
MKIKKNIRHFHQTFFHPRVFVFILTGTLIIFLTFLTTSNALEIAISGIASVFIGIGVNNFSSIEVQIKNDRKLKSKTGHAVRLMEITKEKISRLYNEAAEENIAKMKSELIELEQFIALGIELMNEDN